MCIDGKTEAFVENTRLNVEFAKQLHKLLIYQSLGRRIQHLLHPPVHQQTVENETGIDRFAQIHRARQQTVRRIPLAHFLDDIQLMQNDINPSAHNPSTRRLSPPKAMSQRHSCWR